MIHGKALPYDRCRTVYSLRGVVIEHMSKRVGRWWWAKLVPAVRVRLNSGQWEVFNRMIREDLDFVPFARPAGIELVLDVRLEQGLNQFPVGCEVGLMFGLAPWYEQDQGSKALKLMGLQIIGPGISLVNEILTA